MSCKENINPASRSKHYTTMEKKVFLQILERYKHVVEVKKSDITTLKDKEVAWTEICNIYNESSLIAQERTTQQLKKLWTNLKQSQRNALTKERQARMATGGGPELQETTVDPDITNIIPHLMTTAPCPFTSNMTESQLNEKRDLAYDLISTEQDADVLQINTDDNNDVERNTCNDEIMISIDTAIPMDTVIPIDTAMDTNNNNTNNDKTLQETTAILEAKYRNKVETIGKEKRVKKQRQQIYEKPGAEEKLRMERIKQIMKQEQQLADIKLQHEESMAKIKENHLKEMNQLELNNLKEVHDIEIQINKTKLRILEHNLKENK